MFTYLKVVSNRSLANLQRAGSRKLSSLMSPLTVRGAVTFRALSTERSLSQAECEAILTIGQGWGVPQGAPCPCCWCGWPARGSCPLSGPLPVGLAVAVLQRAHFVCSQDHKTQKAAGRGLHLDPDRHLEMPGSKQGSNRMALQPYNLGPALGLISWVLFPHSG